MLLFWILTETVFAAEEFNFTLQEIWEHAGWVQRIVLITLAVMCIGCIMVLIERLIAYRRASQQSVQLAAAIVGHLQKADIAKALAVAREEEYKSAYLGAMLRAGLAEVDARFDRFGIESAKRVIEKAIILELAKLRRGTALLATTGATAPFVGLFGTTFGVINAFQAMAVAGAGLGSISAAIAEALLATGVGIGVAIIGVWFFNYCNNRIEKVGEELASSQTDFVDWAEKELLRRTEQATREASK